MQQIEILFGIYFFQFFYNSFSFFSQKWLKNFQLKTFDNECVFITIIYDHFVQRFRHLLSQEASTHSMNRSLVAIKEHGILISDEMNSGYQPFWVIG